jgi:RNA-binding protein
MSNLTSKQRAFLRAQAHRLKPVIHVGNEGVTPDLLGAVVEAFNTRELLKVRVLESAPEDARETGAAIAAAIDGVEIPQTIGRMVVLYRPFPDGPELELPGKGSPAP